MSPDTIHHTEAVFSIVRRIYGREHDDPMDDLDVTMDIWGIFLNATLRAAVHLGQDNEANLRYVKNNLWNSVGLSLHETGKLISDPKEITGVSWVSKMLRGCRQAYCVKRHIRSPTPKPTSSPTLCSMWENGRWSCCDLEEQRLNGLRKTITSMNTESNRWNADGVRVENIHRNHDVGLPQEKSV